MLTCQPSKGQEAKRSWLPADNPAPGWNSGGQGYLLLQERCRETGGACVRETLPLLALLRSLALCYKWAPRPLWHAGGRVEGSATQLCAHASRKQEENVNL